MSLSSSGVLRDLLVRTLSRLKGFARFCTAERAWWFGLCCITIFRWALAAKDEIISLPADSSNYAYLAVAYLTGLPMDRLPSQRPGIGLLAQAAAGLGIPYKLLLDAVVCLLAFQVATLIRRWTRSTTLGLITYGSLAVNQWFILFSQTFMSEPATALTLVAVWIATLPIFVVPPRYWSPKGMLPAGLASGFLVLLRPEDAVIYGYWLLVSVLAWVAWRGHWRALGPSRRWSCLGIALLPIACSWGTVVVWNQIHRIHYGIPAMTQTDTPGMKSLLNTLYSIRPVEEIRFAPVTRKTLAEACEQSPTLNRYRERLLDSNGVFYQEAKRRLGLNGEVGTWLNWHLVNAFAVGDARSESDKLLAAAELNDALQRGRLQKRWAVYPIDPLWREWAPELPRVFREGFVESFSPLLPVKVEEIVFGAGNVSPLEQGAFDDGLLRRRGTRNQLVLRINGRTPATASIFRRVRVTNSKNQVLGNERVVRDSQAGFKFTATLEIDSSSAGQAIFVEFLAGETDIRNSPRFLLPLSGRSTWVNVSLPEGQRGEQKANDEFWNLGGAINLAANDWRIQAKTILAQWRMSLTVGLTLLCFGVGFFSRLGGRRRRLLIIWLLAGWGLVFGRMAYYVFCETWLCWGLSRYLGPNYFLVAALWGPALFVSGQLLFLALRGLTRTFVFRRKTTSGAATTLSKI